MFNTKLVGQLEAAEATVAALQQQVEEQKETEEAIIGSANSWAARAEKAEATVVALTVERDRETELRRGAEAHVQMLKEVLAQKPYADEYMALEEQVAALRKECCVARELIHATREQRDEHLKEVAALRSALEQIAAYSPSTSTGGRMLAIARAALAAALPPHKCYPIVVHVWTEHEANSVPEHGTRCTCGMRQWGEPEPAVTPPPTTEPK